MVVLTGEWAGRQEREALGTVRLEPSDGGTERTMIQENLTDEEAGKRHEQGWSGLLDKLPVCRGDAEWPT